MSHANHVDSTGRKIPSVSQIPAIFHKDMSGFNAWICKGLHTKDDKCCVKAADNYYQESANLGQDIHAIRESFLRGDTFAEPLPEYQANVFAPVAQFYKESGYKPLQIGTSEGYNIPAIELKMTGKEFGGSCDGFGQFSKPFWDGLRKTVYDKRTREAIESKSIRPPTTEDIFCDDLKIKSKLDVLHPLQLYGYSILLQQCYNLICNWGIIIRREKRLDKTPEIQLRIYYLPLFKEEWRSSMLMWHFLND